MCAFTETIAYQNRATACFPGRKTQRLWCRDCLGRTRRAAVPHAKRRRLLKQNHVVLALVLALVVWAAPARASTITWEVTLAGSNEVPPNGSPATGHGTFVFDDLGTAADADDTLSALVTFSSLVAP